MMDIDGFKKINDTRGHTIGDEILKCVGDVINEHFKHFKCESFRIGGDEFVLLFENKQTSDVEDQMIKMNEKLYNLKGITISYGCCEVDFNNEKPFEEAYKKADTLMYSNKGQKKLHI
jgi:diguanylate cyclase (GGDEF)-like protein